MNLKRKICLLIGLVLILGALLMPVAYANEGYVAWQIEQDGSAIYKNGQKMPVYQGSRAFYLDPRTVYKYENSVQLGDETGYSSPCAVRSSSADAEFVWVSGYSQNYIYASSVGKAELDAFLAGTSVKYTLDEDAKSADISSIDVEALDTAAREQSGTLIVEVKSLENQQRYDIVAHDSTFTFAYVHGAVYYVDNTYYYISYDMLGNNYFDANGNFSYRSGTVSLSVVDPMCASAIEQAKSELKAYEVQYLYEGGGYYEESSPTAHWVVFILACVIPPIPLMVVGISQCVSSENKRWLVFTLLTALWLLLAILFAVILLI